MMQTLSTIVLSELQEFGQSSTSEVDEFLNALDCQLPEVRVLRNIWGSIVLLFASFSVDFTL